MSARRVEELENALRDALDLAKELNNYAKEIAADDDDDESADYCECTDEEIQRLANILEDSQ